MSVGLLDVLENLSLVFWSLVLTPLAYVVYRVFRYEVWVRRMAKAAVKFPGEPRHWLWGHIHKFPGPNEKGLAYNLHLTKLYPRVHNFFVTNHPVITVHHPETVKIILKTSEPKPMGFGVYRYSKNWLGDGLLTSSGAKWARNRRLLTPAFHFDILKPYIKIKNDCVDIFLEKLSKFADSGESEEMFVHISLLTFDTILRCACSYEDNIQTKGKSHPYVHAVMALGDLWVNRLLQPWLIFDFLYNMTKSGRDFRRHCEYVHSISNEVIQTRKQTLAEEKTKNKPTSRYLDFLDILLTARDEDGQGLTDSEIRDEVDTFLFEGHDTTASSISFALYSLAQNPEHQTLCQEEIDGVLEGRDNDNIEWDDLPKLKYLTLCIKESMRLHAPVPFIERKVTSDLVIDGVTIPRGLNIAINIYNLHHNPTVWEQPMEFRPSRFLQENIEKMDSYAYVPFSAGPRNCIGQHFAMHEQKVLLARILRRFSFELDPSHPVEKKMGVVMKTMSGLYLKTTRRSTDVQNKSSDSSAVL